MDEKRIIRLIEGTARDDIPAELQYSDEDDEQLRRVNVFKEDKLALVGIYVNDDGVSFYCFPKYYSKTEIEDGKKDSELENIVKALIKLRKEGGKSIDEVGAEFWHSEKNSEERRVNPLKLARNLIVDYMENGLYFEEINEKKTHGSGKTLWGKTVLKMRPMITDNDEVVYLRRILRRRNLDYNNILTGVHAAVLLQCLELLQNAGYSKGMRVPGIYRKIAVKSDNGTDLSRYKNVLRERLKKVYKDRDVSLIKMMSAWCTNFSRYYKVMACTTTFQNVWEQINDYVFGNIGEKESDPPTYYVGNNEYEFHNKSDDRLDTVYLDIEKRRLVVFDSKYYVPDFSETVSNKGTVWRYPAQVDIRKQVAYLKQIRITIEGDHKTGDSHDKPRFAYSNIFLFPFSKENYKKVLEEESVGDNLYVRIGYVEGSVFRELKNIIYDTDDKKGNKHFSKYDRVDLYVVNPDKLYTNYIDDVKVEPDEIECMICRFGQKENCGGLLK